MNSSSTFNQVVPFFAHDGVHTWMMVQKPQTTTWDGAKTLVN